jgi:hypothetical protein
VEIVEHRADSRAEGDDVSPSLAIQPALSERDFEIRIELALRSHGDRDVVLVRSTAFLASPPLCNVGRN